MGGLQRRPLFRGFAVIVIGVLLRHACAAEAHLDTAGGQSVSIVGHAAHEFDATFLRGDRTIVFARAQDFSQDRIDLYYSSLVRGSYDAGLRLPETVNDTVRDTYGAMIDWSQPDRL